MTIQSHREPRSVLNFQDAGVQSLDRLSPYVWRLATPPPPQISSYIAYSLPVIVGWKCNLHFLFFYRLLSCMQSHPCSTVPPLLGSSSPPGSVMISLSRWYPLHCLPPQWQNRSLFRIGPFLPLLRTLRAKILNLGLLPGFCQSAGTIGKITADTSHEQGSWAQR